jgi:hypothetical protein
MVLSPKRGFIVTCIILFLVYNHVLFAFEHVTGKRKHRAVGLGYLMVGGNSLNMDALNSCLERKGLDSFHNQTFSFGIGIQGTSRRLIVGGEGCLLSAHKATNNSVEQDVKSRITGAFGFFDFGLILVSKERFRIYPLLGCGYGGILLRLRKKVQIYPNTGDPYVDKYLYEERMVDYEYTANGFILNLSFGMDFMLESGENIPNTSGGFILGLRTGYIFSPFKNSWEMDGIEISSDPAISMMGPYVSIIFGAGHIGRAGVFF